jgi:hypothetical protein
MNRHRACLGGLMASALLRMNFAAAKPLPPGRGGREHPGEGARFKFTARSNFAAIHPHPLDRSRLLPEGEVKYLRRPSDSRATRSGAIVGNLCPRVVQCHVWRTLVRPIPIHRCGQCLINVPGGPPAQFLPRFC